MRRETSNFFRMVIEDILPPALRDTILFKRAASLVLGRHIGIFADFRRRAPFLTAEEYERVYREYPRVHQGTDNSNACVLRICSEVVGASVLDVGCGGGHLLQTIIASEDNAITRAVGADFIVPKSSSDCRIQYVQTKIETLPFQDGEFDTVICTHVLEHILDVRKAIAELRRVTRRRLIIVVPSEREGIYSFNPHFNFFPYPHSFLRAMIPVPRNHLCELIGRDIYYREDDGTR